MSSISEALLEKFLKGECTEEEAAAVEAWFEAHPEEVFLLDEYEAGQEGPGLQEDAGLPEGYREDMRNAISAATVPGQKNRILVLRPYLAAAVMLALVACW